MKNFQQESAHFSEAVVESVVQYVQPSVKILFLDIETAPLYGAIWSLWQNGISLNQLHSDWFILSYCAKWAHSDEIFYGDLRGTSATQDDSKLLHELWHLMNEADFVVAHNGRKFDDRKIKARMIMNGLVKPLPYRIIDTLEIAKREFSFTSNKLEYLTGKLCKKYKKQKHGKFAGQELWTQCMKENPEAWEEMRIYNTYDVLSLEELYGIFSAWDSKLPNFDVFKPEGTDADDWVEEGSHYTNLGKYRVYRNRKTGALRRGRSNELTPEQRSTLLANI